MKPKKTLAALTALWVLLVFLEGASSLIRRWYSRKMGVAARAVSGVISFGKLTAMIVLALSNVLLFLRHVDSGNGSDRVNGGGYADIKNR
ncbi:hypothetical protein R80B4_01739 [Fibrobacteres bacterium R8-0-B4]